MTRQYVKSILFQYVYFSDVDECALNDGGCHVNADCFNTIGNFSCVCKDGYYGDGFNCTGITVVSPVMCMLNHGLE